MIIIRCGVYSNASMQGVETMTQVEPGGSKADSLGLNALGFVHCCRKHVFVLPIASWLFAFCHVDVCCVSVSCVCMHTQCLSEALLHMEKFCKPCLNDNVRTALCDLLKWLLGAALKPLQRRLPNQAYQLNHSTQIFSNRFLSIAQ